MKQLKKRIYVQVLQHFAQELRQFFLQIGFELVIYLSILIKVIAISFCVSFAVNSNQFPLCLMKNLSICVCAKVVYLYHYCHSLTAKAVNFDLFVKTMVNNQFNW